MKLLLLLLAGASWGQVGRKAVTVKVHAGTTYCTFTNYQPMALTGLHIECGSPTANSTSDTVIAVGTVGLTGQFLAGSDSVSWRFIRPTADGVLMYRVTANGLPETGSL